MGGASGRRRVYRILVGKPEGVRQLGRNRRIGKDNIKTTLSKMVGWRTLDSSESGQKHIAGCGNHGYEFLD